MQQTKNWIKGISEHYPYEKNSYNSCQKNLTFWDINCYIGEHASVELTLPPTVNYIQETSEISLVTTSYLF